MTVTVSPNVSNAQNRNCSTVATIDINLMVLTTYLQIIKPSCYPTKEKLKVSRPWTDPDFST